ncbi:transposase [Octadecabacter antarcticus]|uniref:transposase n=1 Tax=Octadecabacter antarcticus TaxID=1217908 RepID=UPI0016514D00
MTKRRNFSDNFKATVALEALRGDKTVQEIAAKRQLHPTQVSTWKRQAIEGMAGFFTDKVKSGLVTLTFRSLNSFMRPFVQMPRGFYHLATSACALDYKIR